MYRQGPVPDAPTLPCPHLLPPFPLHDPRAPTPPSLMARRRGSLYIPNPSKVSGSDGSAGGKAVAVAAVPRRTAADGGGLCAGAAMCVQPERTSQLVHATSCGV